MKASEALRGIAAGIRENMKFIKGTPLYSGAPFAAGYRAGLAAAADTAYMKAEELEYEGE